MEEIKHDYNFNFDHELLKVFAILAIAGIISFLIWKGSESSIIEVAILTLLSFVTGLVINPNKK